jgi:hypothetical protein
MGDLAVTIKPKNPRAARFRAASSRLRADRLCFALERFARRWVRVASPIMKEKLMKAPFAAIAFALAVAVASPALADRPPTPEERAKIESVLRAAGFERWEEIEFDDGVWEVDDAIGADGREYDLKLDPRTFAIIEKKLD